MKIAVALTCLMALATLGGVTGSSEQELDGEIQSQSIDAFNTFQESRVDPQLRKRACKKSLGGKCIKRRRDCPNNLPLETKPGGPYCNKRRRCCYPVTRCSPTQSCTLAGGYCFSGRGECNGRVDPYGCRDRQRCRCCIPDDVLTPPMTCPTVSCETSLTTSTPTNEMISFDEYTSKFNLQFENEAEEQKRREIFEDNIKIIQDHNKLHDSGKTSYRKGLNEYSHLTYEEVTSLLTGFNVSAAALRQDSNNYYNPVDPGNEPCFVNWVNQGVLNPMQNQGICGSCWAFSATCVIESQIMQNNGVLQKLSEQYLVDCDTTDNGCQGGMPSRAIDYVINNGIALASGYPYTGKDGACDNSAPKTSYSMKSMQSINPGNVKDLQNACVHIGPISVAIYASPNFHSYKSGILVDPLCTTDKKVNHAVVLVGYGDENGHGYWLVMNSWGTSWGEEGYIKMSRSQHNICKISDYAVFPIEFDCTSAGGERVDGKCLTFNRERLSWTDAKVACTSASKSGQLASFYNTEAVYNYIATNHAGAFWTGGNDIVQEGVFKWLDGRTCDPYPWYPNRPWNTPAEGKPYRCIEVWGGTGYGPSGYGSYACSATRGYICEIVG